ncbi:MAG: trehalose-phosphatase [Gemmatimonadetes bacterium]|nr:trehalose-phosphatase [Gemmatimonadota bacterium]
MLPHALTRIDAWRGARRRAGRLLVALDYDGTLVPIVARPVEAELPAAAREVLARLAARPDTDVAVVSGRELEDLRARVAIEGLYYAGNHGLEIEGPGLERKHPDALALRPRMARCGEKLRARLAGISGVVVEEKGLTASVHYRLVEEAGAVARVRATVRELCGSEPRLRLTEGKKVLEVRPAVDWDKGRATRYLLDALAPGPATLIPALFIGDDRTDEDAFTALRDHGEGIVVATSPPPTTAATFYLRDPAEVIAFLAALAAAG